MKKVLFVVTAFYPENAIGAIRYTKLAKYFLKAGFDVAVVSPYKENIVEDTTLLFENYGNIKHIRIPYGNLVSRFNNKFLSKVKSINSNISKKVGKKASIKSKLANLATIFYTFMKNYSWYSAVKNSSNFQSLLNHDFYDVLITGHPSFSSHFFGRKFKKLSKEVFWIADYRDPVYNSSTPWFLATWAKSFARQVTKHADVITTISHGCLDNLFFDKHPHKVVIPNGFDADDISDIKYSLGEKFTLSYLGGLYTSKRDLSPLFSVIRDLIDEKLLEAQKIQIFYAGPSKIDFQSQVEKFQLTGIIVLKDSIPRIEALQKQLESHLLILATWNNAGEEGVVTGKFLEYMMMNRPIIALVSGNRKGSAVKSMMLEGNLGICYEEANKTSDYTLLKNYVLKQYNHFFNNELLEFHPKQEFIQKFNYKNIAQEFINLLPKQ